MKERTHILIVEDNAADAELAKRAIQKTLKGCEFQVVDSRKNFLHALQSFQPDVILSDYSLPQFDGMQALQLTLKHAPLTPLLIWTGSISEDVAVDCMKAGASNYVLKENPKRLGPAIVRALEEKELVAAHKRAEEALQNNERRFRVLVQNGLASIALLTDDGTLIWESPAITGTLNYAPNEHLGRNFFRELMHPDDLPWTQEIYARLVQEPGSSHHGICRLRHASGQWHWVEAIITNMLHEPGINAIVANYRDVNEHKQAEIELQQKNNDLALINSLNEVINRGADLDAVVNLLREEINRVFSSEYTNIYLLDQDGQSIKIQNYSIPQGVTKKIEKIIGRAIPTIEIPIQDEGLFRSVLRSAHSAIINDPKVIQNWIGEFVETASLSVVAKAAIRKFIPQIHKILNIKSVILVPLIADGKILGLLNVSSSNDFTIEDLKRIENICGHFTVAIRRKQVEDALRDSQARYQNLVETSHDLIWSVDAEGKITFLNRAANEIYGYEPEEMIGRPFTEIMATENNHPVDFEQIKEKIGETSEYTGVESRVHHRDGREIILSANSIVLRDSQGKITGITGSSHDITERKRVEEALKEERNLLRTLIDHIPDRIYAMDRQGRKTLSNTADWKASGGKSRDDVIGRTDFDYYPSEWAQGLWPLDKAVLESGEPVINVEEPGLDAEGNPVSILTTKIPLRDDCGRVIGLVGVGRDITERRQTEERINDLLAFNEKILNHSPTGILTYKLTGECVFANQNAASIVGASVEMLRAQNFNTTESWKKSGLYDLVMKAINTQEEVTADIHHISTFGKDVWMAARCVTFRSKEEAHVLLALSDITERREAEERLRLSENRYRLVTKATNDVIWEWNPKKHQLHWSENAHHVFGYSKEEIGPDETWWDIRIHPDDRERVVTKLDDLIAGNESIWLEEYRFQLRDGSYAYISDRGYIERDGNGDPIRMIGAMSNITSRKEAEIERQALLEIMQALANTKDLQELLQLVHSAIAKVIYAENFFVVLYQQNSGLFEEIYSVDQYDPPEPPSKLEKSITSYIFRSGEPLLVTQALFDELAKQGEVKLVGTNSASWLGVPLKTSGKTIGVMAVQDYENDNRYSERDKDFLTSIAAQIALIIERMQAEEALRESEEHYRAIFEGVQDAIFVESMDGKILMVNERACEMFGYSRAEFLVTKVADLVPEGHPIIMFDGTDVSLSAEPRESINRRANGEPFPIEISGRVHVIDGEKVFLVVVRDITERKRAEEEIRRRAEETAALLATSLALTNLDLKVTLQTIGNSAKTLFAADGCRIFLMEADGETLRCVLALQEKLDIFSDLKIKVGQGVTGAVAATGRAEIVNEMQKDPRALQVAGTPEEEEAIMFAPLKERDRTIGIISIRRTGCPSPFYPADLELLEAFASMAASAVSNAHFFEETQRRLDELQALYENGLAVSRLLAPSEIGKRVIKTFENYLHWHHVMIRLRKEESDDLELVAFSLPHLDEKEVSGSVQRYIALVNQVGQGLSGWVIQTGTQLRTGNVHAYPQYIDIHPGIQSGLYMPLKAGERVIGAISVESETPDAFTEQDERLLATLANQTAVAFENARLYEAMQKELSERKRAEEALRISETHYRALADSITDILFEMDQNLRYIHWNKASESLMGIQAENAIGKSMQEIFGESEEQARIQKIYEDVLKTHHPRSFETELFLLGEKRLFEINAYPSTRGVSVVAKDVTDRKRSEVILQKRFELMEFSAHHSLSELMQRAVDEVSELTSSTIGFFHFVEPDQATLGMQTWSTNALRLFHVPLEEGSHLPLDQAGVWAEAVRQRRPLIQNDYEALVKKKGLPPGHVPIVREMVIPIIRNERLMAVMGVGNKPQDYTSHDLEITARLADYAWDVTERKQMEVALEAERNQLAQRVEQRTADLSRANSNLARALRVKDEFLANMSHELRTPLNAILGLSESLGEQIAGPLNEKQQKYVGTISESGHHLLSLINDILDLAKVESGQITLDINRVDIRAVCQASLRMIKQLAQKKNQEVSLEIDDGLGLIWADERRLKQMIVNLLGNAVKFTPENGRLGLKVHGDPDSNQVRITVWDNGIGIKADDLERLFQPFVQLDSGLSREASGTGLGLALVAQMARLHGGSVTVVSEPGNGSQFTIVVPWEPALAVDAATRMRTTGKFRAIKFDQTNRPKILLVEDTQEVTLMIQDYLEQAGFQVVTAQDGTEAIRQAKLEHPNLILMDVQMPRLNGLEATRKLRSEPDFKYTPIIALTALAMPSDRERCIEAGMDEYISKPVNLKALVKIIQSCLFSNQEPRQT